MWVRKIAKGAWNEEPTPWRLGSPGGLKLGCGGPLVLSPLYCTLGLSVKLPRGEACGSADALDNMLLAEGVAGPERGGSAHSGSSCSLPRQVSPDNSIRHSDYRSKLAQIRHLPLRAGEI